MLVKFIIQFLYGLQKIWSVPHFKKKKFISLLDVKLFQLITFQLTLFFTKGTVSFFLCVNKKKVLHL